MRLFHRITSYSGWGNETVWVHPDTGESVDGPGALRAMAIHYLRNARRQRSVTYEIDTEELEPGFTRTFKQFTIEIYHWSVLCRVTMAMRWFVVCPLQVCLFTVLHGLCKVVAALAGCACVRSAVQCVSIAGTMELHGGPNSVDCVCVPRSVHHHRVLI